MKTEIGDQRSESDPGVSFDAEVRDAEPLKVFDIYDFTLRVLRDLRPGAERGFVTLGRGA